MKKLALLIVSILVISNSFSQELKYESPNYKKISKEIKKKNSKLYYKNLFNRYLNGDTTFTLNEKRHLYYGYSFQKEYSPYTSSVYKDSLNIFFAKDSLTENDFLEIARFSLLILEEQPFDVRSMNYLSYSYYNLDNIELENIYNNKISIILDAIMSTGNGISEETAFSVIYVSHEYDILNILGFEFGGMQSLTSSGYDYLKLEENEYETEGLFFEISRSLGYLNKLLK